MGLMLAYLSGGFDRNAEWTVFSKRKYQRGPT